MSLGRPTTSAELEELTRPLASAMGTVVGRTRWLVGLLALLYLGSGITAVGEDEVAVVLRFGRVTGSTPADQVHRPGLLFAFPRPIDEVVRVPVERVREVELAGLDRGEDAPFAASIDQLPRSIDPTTEGYALTADRNVLQTRAQIRYSIQNPIAYALESEQAEALLESTVQAALVRVIASTPVDVLVRARREAIGRDTIALATPRLDALGIGVELLAVELTKPLLPPLQLYGDFDAVQGARLEGTRTFQEALAYRELELPRAEADAARVLADARIESARLLARANARAETFDALVEEHRRAPEALRRRLLEESRSTVFENAGETSFVPPDLENFRVTISGRR